MLCINFDDSRYRDLSARLMGLCRRDLFLAAGDEPPAEPAASVLRPTAPELAVSRGRVSSETAAQEAIAHELEGLDVAADRLTSDERLKVIAALDERGVFLIKGAVKDVATALGCSQASVYRYLTQLKNDKKLKQDA
jgi:predicted transcriptional regulator YheO